VKPDFLFIGPDKTGSTWLYRALRSHPEIFVPSVKDIYFFDRYYHRGLDWYEHFFEAAPPTARAVGELSHDYLFSPLAASRIEADLPGVRLLTSLRNPAERTFSQYLYLRRSGLTKRAFPDALTEFPELVDNSLYHKHLSGYRERFPPERLLVLFFDDLRSDPVQFARDVFQFLSVNPEAGRPPEERVLPAGRPRSVVAARIAKEGANLARRFGFPRLVGAVKEGALARHLYVAYEDDEKPRLEPEWRALLVDRFREDVERLQDLTGRDLGDWLRTT
jgi:hypothetical protein